MKAARYIMKVAAALAAIGAAVCLVIAYWETLVDLFYALVGKIKEKRAQFVLAKADADEFEDFVDDTL